MDRLKPVTLSPLRVAVLLGGESAERKISLQSGRAVAEAISCQGHTVVSIDPAETDLATADWSGIDVAFLALHGTFGEDGGVQEILERLRVPFTGSDSVASRLAFSKVAAKKCFAEHGVPTPDAFLFSQTDSPGRIETWATDLGLPVVVKPDAQGSSIGVTIVREASQLADAVEQCLAVSETGLIEKAIEGSEWTLGVIDDVPLPLIQIRTDRSFFDFTAKYEDDGTGYHFDAEIDDATRSRIETAGLAACRALGTTGIARADVMLDADGHPWVLEVNTIPGMTDHSLVPKAAERIGLSLGELCDIVISRTLAQDKQRKLRDAS
ncbi:MAG: D-alanine--D-alanine ligase [Planctomycetota bacterium]|nr:D-alanine--D-alanine ligase [Planctomycetota bacterium]MDA1248126.1 D-alanine--D-alanine ligase [Planctomycetota bacterium]